MNWYLLKSSNFLKSSELQEATINRSLWKYYHIFLTGNFQNTILNMRRKFWSNWGKGIEFSQVWVCIVRRIHWWFWFPKKWMKNRSNTLNNKHLAIKPYMFEEIENRGHWVFWTFKPNTQIRSVHEFTAPKM